ncbi:MAG: hypothetical protein J6M19_02555 [Bacteroidaceae bacterium]|nr:hypothetical protein [Bacteroidaceae bacterium]
MVILTIRTGRGADEWVEKVVWASGFGRFLRCRCGADGGASGCFPEVLKNGGFQCLKTGVSHTPTIGVSHTCTIGVTHTCFEAMEGVGERCRCFGGSLNGKT